MCCSETTTVDDFENVLFIPNIRVSRAMETTPRLPPTEVLLGRRCRRGSGGARLGVKLSGSLWGEPPWGGTRDAERMGGLSDATAVLQHPSRPHLALPRWHLCWDLRTGQTVTWLPGPRNRVSGHRCLSLRLFKLSS